MLVSTGGHTYLYLKPLGLFIRDRKLKYKGFFVALKISLGLQLISPLLRTEYSRHLVRLRQRMLLQLSVHFAISTSICQTRTSSSISKREFLRSGWGRCGTAQPTLTCRVGGCMRVSWCSGYILVVGRTICRYMRIRPLPGRTYYWGWGPRFPSNRNTLLLH